jgi:CcmD family protein
MEPLLVAGYTLLFAVLFGYLFRLQRRILALEQQIEDL